MRVGDEIKDESVGEGDVIEPYATVDYSERSGSTL